MDTKTFIASVVLLAGIILHLNSINGLKCKVCVLSEHSNIPCEVQPCNSIADLKGQVRTLVKRTKINKEQKEKALRILDKGPSNWTPTGFVCVRTNMKVHGTEIVSSACNPKIPEYPPSNNPYSVKDFLDTAMDYADPAAMKQMNVTEETIQQIRKMYSKMSGEVYVCDEDTGNGPNCGEHAVLDESESSSAHKHLDSLDDDDEDE